MKKIISTIFITIVIINLIIVTESFAKEINIIENNVIENETVSESEDTTLIENSKNNVNQIENENNVTGKVYTLEKNANYEHFLNNDSQSSQDTDIYGNFIIDTVAENNEAKDIPEYFIKNDKLNLYYNYEDKYIENSEENWKLINIDNDKILDKKFDNKIENGGLLIQTSKDRVNWVNVIEKTNIFGENSESKECIYSATNDEISQGCYYRVIVVYARQKKIEPNRFLFMTFDNYQFEKKAEVYEFYAIKSSEQGTNTRKYTLAKDPVRTKNFSGYYGKQDIDVNDPHYGWSLGSFYMKGYTNTTIDSNGDVVFFKDGIKKDNLTLFFELAQDIDRLDNKDGIYISQDKNGYDQDFGTKPKDFGKGMLICKFTDNSGDSKITEEYYNYLESVKSLNANTEINFSEEGDYELALDYEITKDQLIDQKAHYRMYFKFSIRNSNNMIYPFDILTGAELRNNSITENGFKLSLANSKYTEIYIKKEVLNETGDGLSEDVRFNTMAKDNSEYTDEGIYTITVKNKGLPNQQDTIKRICVGKNKTLKAITKNNLSAIEVKQLVNNGTKIKNDGTIENDSLNKDGKSNYIAILIIGLIVVFLIIFIIIKKRKRLSVQNTIKDESKVSNDKNNSEINNIEKTEDELNDEEIRNEDNNND